MEKWLEIMQNFPYFKLSYTAYITHIVPKSNVMSLDSIWEGFGGTIISDLQDNSLSFEKRMAIQHFLSKSCITKHGTWTWSYLHDVTICTPSRSWRSFKSNIIPNNHVIRLYPFTMIFTTVCIYRSWILVPCCWLPAMSCSPHLPVAIPGQLGAKDNGKGHSGPKSLETCQTDYSRFHSYHFVGSKFVEWVVKS